MSIIGSILSKIFTGAAGEAEASTLDQPASMQKEDSVVATAPSGTATSATVDVAAVLADLASKTGQALDWQKSIVDLLKLLDLDSSLAARKTLAKELNYAGDTSDSAAMNVWLHKQVMRKLAENGGKVPDDLKS